MSGSINAMLLPKRVRARIATVVHGIVATKPNQPGGYGCCDLYACAGAAVANAYLQAAHYRARAGLLLCRTRAAGWVQCTPHAWIEAERGRGVELADLAARHYPAYAAGMGLALGEHTVPDYLWMEAGEWERSPLPWRLRPDAGIDRDYQEWREEAATRETVAWITAEALVQLLHRSGGLFV